VCFFLPVLNVKTGTGAGNDTFNTYYYDNIKLQYAVISDMTSVLVMSLTTMPTN
jgi:hypothetical protein